jgi:hypothetical protein
MWALWQMTGRFPTPITRLGGDLKIFYTQNVWFCKQASIVPLRNPCLIYSIIKFRSFSGNPKIICLSVLSLTLLTVQSYALSRKPVALAS